MLSALYSLEEDWTDVVGHESSLGLDEKTRSQQTALWELVETEVAYIRTLKVIQDVSIEMITTKQNLFLKRIILLYTYMLSYTGYQKSSLYLFNFSSFLIASAICKITTF